MQAFRYKRTYVFFIIKQFSYDGGTDMGVFGFGKEDKGFDPGNFPIDVCNVFLVFEIVDGSNSSHDAAGSDLFGKIDGEIIVLHDVDVLFFFKKPGDHLHPVFK